MGQTRTNRAGPPRPQIINYPDLSGGLDTATDIHALDRNQLSQSINCWYGYGRSLSKRPGSKVFVTGATGSGVACTGMASARFAGVTYIVVQCGRDLYAAKEADSAWVKIGTMGVGAGSISAAQMFEPNTGKDTLFIVNGVDTPLAWQGPATSLVAASTLTTPNLPLNYAGSAIITPSCVTTFQNFLLYSGEKTKPTAVYVSNPEFPNNFTNPASLNPTGSDPNYNPYVVGANDGINGGGITALCTLEDGVLIFKEAAVYSFVLTGLYNDTIFKPTCLSASIGSTAPQSIARFDRFVAFLAMDGVYQVSIGAGVSQISARIPTYFDASLAGDGALITNRTTAVGVRHGGRYLLFFSAINSTPMINATGVWFDFTKLDQYNQPTTGEIAGMAVAGAASLRNKGDDGNFVWCDSGFDRVGKFGLGFTDPSTTGTGFTAPITSIFAGKADFMDDVFGPDGALRPKEIKKVWLVLSLGGHTQSTLFSGSIQFQFSWTGGLAQRPVGSTRSVTLIAGGSSSNWGADWGSLNWSSGSNVVEPYVVIEADMPSGAQANNALMQFSESSTNGFTVIGYRLEVLDRQPQQDSYLAV